MIIAQLTDLHIKAGGKTAYAGKVDTFAKLQRAVEHLNAMRPQPDLVLITGDLGDFGRVEEYRQARQALDRLQMPFYLVPGNHDERQALRDAFVDHSYLFQADTHLSYVIEGLPLRLVGLDTSVPGKPHGELDGMRRDWLETALSQAPERRTLLFMHHPPVAVGLDHMDVQRLHGSDELATALQRHPQVELILCGHLHRPVEFIWCNRPVYVGSAHNHAVTLDLTPEAPSSFTLEPAMIRLIYLHPQSGMIMSHQSHVGDCDGPHPFFDEQGRLID
ncbi:phosphodiesterase [Marinobacterium stanieri]|uniref:Calcineurin-like phosphoesterase n=1 Tax=Marinobacterium stanieri TaxID=49186 RepID=A0A1N6NP25_9GAMM|nr:phosphodiesterase [Marinobacterium stanieri]SIP93841.1 Calcineurin-like phosphoesterase [Marinobacterium stanieri]